MKKDECNMKFPLLPLNFVQLLHLPSTLRLHHHVCTMMRLIKTDMMNKIILDNIIYVYKDTSNKIKEMVMMYNNFYLSYFL